MPNVHANKLYPKHIAEMMDHYESAARLFCNLQSLDPDKNMQVPHPTIANAKMTIPVWHTCVQMLADFDLRLLALMSTWSDRKPQEEPPKSTIITG